MENTRIKYLVMTSIEEELDTLGVYDSKEEAFIAMQSDFCKAVGVDEKNIDEWLDETDDAAICPMDARALDCTTEDGQNHDNHSDYYARNEFAVAFEKFLSLVDGRLDSLFCGVVVFLVCHKAFECFYIFIIVFSVRTQRYAFYI